MRINEISPLVSIRIPAYNHERFVCNTLDSILAQDYENIEIIIIDDGSSDNTWYEIQKWIESHREKIPIWAKRHSENKGITSTLNELISACNGKYIAGIASDDYLLPGSVGSRVRFLEENENKDAVFADCTVIDEDGIEFMPSGLKDFYCMNTEKLQDEKTLFNELILNWGVPGGTLMVRRSVYDSHKYDERLLVEDFDFFLKLLTNNKLGFIDNKVSAYRVHKSNISSNRSVSIKRKVDFIRTVFSHLPVLKSKQKLILILSVFKRLLKF